jgi:broad specificity phosphatase PhoE
MATATPLKERLGLDITLYDNLDSLAATILSEHLGDTVLVVGHSNTVTSIVETIAGRDFYTSTPQVNDFDNLFLVSRPVGGGPATVLNLQYGADTSPDTSNLSRDGATTIVAVPHAETSGTALSTAGAMRADTLPHVLGKAGIAAIYAATTAPARATASPLAAALAQTATEFTETDMMSLVAQITANHTGKTVAVVASQAALRSLVDVLGARPVPIIYPNEHDVLLIIRQLDTERPFVTRLEYGEASP